MIDSIRRGMAGPGSFGHDGAGGQLAFANPDSAVSFAYTTIRPGGVPDMRAELLSAALRSCL
jgi:CubicO group peptidase (beta-lactamase class C family)